MRVRVRGRPVRVRVRGRPVGRLLSILGINTYVDTIQLPSSPLLLTPNVIRL